MNRSLSLLSALTLSSASLLAPHTQAVKAMNIAFDCFERSSEKLVARSAVDITSTSISCLPVPGSTLTDGSSSDSEAEDIFVDNVIEEEDEDWDDGPEYDIADSDIYDEDEYVEEDGETNPGQSTGSQLGDALGQHLGNLIGQGFADLFR